MSRVCLWTFGVLLAITTQRAVVFCSQAFIVDTPNGTVHVDPSGMAVSRTGNPIDRHWISQIKSFLGNTTHPDDFKLLLQDGDHMIVGARNTVYNISLETMKCVKKLTWPSTNFDVMVCRAKRKTEGQCQNYIHVAVKVSPSEILICGTNSFKPLCRTYHNEPGKEYYHNTEYDGIGKCPYDPHHNSTAIRVDGELYSATVGDFSAGDALIYKYPMRTEQHDSQWLNDPDFVHSLVYGNKVYIFFRETAVENINCGKTVFSRVARICKNDKGGAQLLRNVWTSFFKARLNCSIPGEFPFYFNELQSTTDVGKGNYMPALEYDNRTDMVYAVFNTPSNSITGSAVCAFRFSDILRTFEGQFKTQDSAHSNWLPVHESDTPKPHPAKQCANDSRRISDQTLNFIKSHPLMDGAVPAFGGKPILLQTSFKYRLTTVAIDWQVSAANQRYYDILYVGTDDGRVIKAINKGRTGKIETQILRTYKVFDDPITSIRVYRNSNLDEEKLIVISKDEIKSIPLYDCNPDYTCNQCVQLQDPYCSFHKGACGTSRRGFQNIERGTHPGCPIDEPSTTHETATTSTINSTTTASPPVLTCPVCVCTPPPSSVASSSGQLQSVGSSPPTVNPDQQLIPVTRDFPDTTNIDNRIPQIPQAAGSMSHSSQGYIYTASHMAIATVLCIVISLVLGLFVGYHISLRRHPRDVCAHLKQPTICTNQLERKGSNSQIDHYSPMPRAKHTNVILDSKLNGHPCTKLDSNNSRQEYV